MQFTSQCLDMRGWKTSFRVLYFQHYKMNLSNIQVELSHPLKKICLRMTIRKESADDSDDTSEKNLSSKLKVG